VAGSPTRDEVEVIMNEADFAQAWRNFGTKIEYDALVGNPD
jgi:hypothetical protein